MAIYKFKSKATGDIIMLGPNGDQVMRILGRQAAEKGIFEVASMGSVIANLEAAVAADESSGADAAAEGSGDNPDATGGAREISLRRRVWPLVEMLRRAQQAGEPVVWGV